MILYGATPSLADAGSKALFVGALCIILSMYGGGFATVPAYLADIFGTKFVGAIHGRLLTAWSLAGVVGSEIIVRVRDYEIAQGVAKTQVYDTVLYIMVGILALGFVCNLLVKPVDAKWLMRKDGAAGGTSSPAVLRTSAQGIGRGGIERRGVGAVADRGRAVAWGLYKALLSAAKILS